MLFRSTSEPESGILIDEHNFPDEFFREYVRGLESDGDGKLSDEEITAVTVIDVGENSIASLKGIEHFTNLRKLYCFSNPISVLDVSRNTSLTLISCSYDRCLEELNLGQNENITGLFCTDTGLSIIDISGCPKLIDCVQNAELIEEEDGARFYTKGESTVAVDIEDTFIIGQDESIVKGCFVVADGVIVGYTGNGGNVEIPNRDEAGTTVVAIGQSVFAGRTNIESVVIPNSVTQIGESAFEGCAGLSSVTLSNRVTEIGRMAFKDCCNLFAMKCVE